MKWSENPSEFVGRIITGIEVHEAGLSDSLCPNYILALPMVYGVEGGHGANFLEGNQGLHVRRTDSGDVKKNAESNCREEHQIQAA